MRAAPRGSDLKPEIILVGEDGEPVRNEQGNPLTYPMSVGRNFAEVLRALDAIQATENVPIATPADWKPGEDVIVALSLNDNEAKEKFGEIDTILPYLRKTKLPS